MCAEWSEKMTGAWSAGSCTCSSVAAAGAIARKLMVRRRRSITASRAGRGIWENLFRELAWNGRSADTQMIDSKHVKAHRSAAGGKGSRSRLLVARGKGATRRFTHSQLLKG